MQDLHRDPPALGVHPVGHLSVAGDILVVEKPRRAGQNRPFPVGRHTAGDDQCRTTTRARGIKCRHPVEVAQFLEPGVHRSHQHPVRQRHVPQIERSE